MSDDTVCLAPINSAKIENMFEYWEARLLGYRILIPVDRMVMVNTVRAFPPAGVRRDKLPMWMKAGGVQIDPWMRGHQYARLRRADGGWLAGVTIQAASGNERSHLTMQLWLLPDDITTVNPAIGGENQ